MFILRDFRFTATVVLRCLWFIDITGWCVHSKIFSFHGHCGRKVSLVHWHNRMMCSFLGNFHFMASVVLRCLWCIDITEWCAHSKVCHFMATVVLSCLWCIDIMEWCVRSFLATVVFRSFWYICNMHSKWSVQSQEFSFYGHCGRDVSGVLVLRNDEFIPNKFTAIA